MYIHVGNAEPVTLTWAQVQRRLAQLIRENKFYDENRDLTEKEEEKLAKERDALTALCEKEAAKCSS